MLLLSSVNREDGELVELDAVLEGQPGMYTGAIVWLAIHADPWVLGMHFVNNLVPLSLHIADDETTEHFISLLGFSDHDTLLGLENFLVFEKFLLPILFLGFCLIIREFKEWLHFPSYFNQSLKSLPNVRFHPFFLNDVQDSDDVDKVFLVVPVSKSGHLEVGSVRHLDLDLLGFLFLMQIYGGDIRDRGSGDQLPLLAFGVLEAFRRGLEVGTHGVLPEWSLKNKTLERQLGWDL
jgi:hypothetical protein